MDSHRHQPNKSVVVSLCLFYTQAFDNSSPAASYVEVSTMGDGMLEFSSSTTTENDTQTSPLSLTTEYDAHTSALSTLNEEDYENTDTDTIESPCLTPPTQQRKLVSFRSPKVSSASSVEDAVAEDELSLSRSLTRNSSFGPTVAGQAGQARKRHLMRL